MNDQAKKIEFFQRSYISYRIGGNLIFEKISISLFYGFILQKLLKKGEHMFYKEGILSQYFTRAIKFWTAGCLIFAVALILFIPRAILANDLFEDHAWQFETTTERAQKGRNS